MIIYKIANYVMGYSELRAENKCTELLNVMLRDGTDYWNLKHTDDGEITFFLLKKDVKRLATRAEMIGCRLVTVRERGLPKLISNYSRRVGIPIGAVLFAVTLWLSTRFVWDIRVVGNDNIGDADIINELERYGFSCGTYIPRVDFYELCNKLQTERDDIAFISVNMIGTTAKVEIIEALEPDRESDNGSPSNLVAARDGYIIRSEVASGMTVARQGMTVREGELLVSGVNEYGRDDDGKFRLVRSKGKVFAATKRDFSVSVPLDLRVKTPTELKECEKTVKIFGKTIKLYENGSIFPSEYDKIENTRRIILFAGEGFLPPIPLPIYVTTSYASMYEEKTTEISEDAAREIASDKLARIIETELADAEVTSRTVEFEVKDTDDGRVLVLNCTLECVENIAREVPIGVK